jgi:hypothetical protein
MPNTFSKIATVSVGSGGAANITFSSIPQSYTDLCLKISGRTSNAYFRDSVEVRLNGSTSNYTSLNLSAQTSTVSSNTATSIVVEIEGDSGTTTGIFGNAEINLPNYTSSDYKAVSIDTITTNNTNNNNMLQIAGGLWSDTSAITSITLISASWLQYSTATLYGITKA